MIVRCTGMESALPSGPAAKTVLNVKALTRWNGAHRVEKTVHCTDLGWRLQQSFLSGLLAVEVVGL